MVWADFPTGLLVADSSPDSCPEWNQWSKKLSISAAQFAGSFVADEGWYITCGLIDHFSLVCVHARKKGFVLFRAWTLLIDNAYMRDDGEQVETLSLGLFHRSGYDVPPLHREVAEKLHPENFDSKRALVIEEENDDKTVLAGKFVRGGAERSSQFWRWLLLTFTDRHDSIIDLFCGVGGLGRVSVEFGRHCFCVDSDPELWPILGDVPSTPDN